MTTRSCEICGTEFVPQQNAQKYCSRECVREAARRRNRPCGQHDAP